MFVYGVVVGLQGITLLAFAARESASNSTNLYVKRGGKPASSGLNYIVIVNYLGGGD